MPKDFQRLTNPRDAVEHKHDTLTISLRLNIAMALDSGGKHFFK